MSNLSKLSAIGVNVERLSGEQREVLAGLSPAEIGVLSSVKHRLESAGGDVEGHTAAAKESDVIGGVIF